jgi:hypothetical protein
MQEAKRQRRSTELSDADRARFARQLTIPSIPQGTRLTLGYILNSIGSDIAEIRLLTQDSNHIAWSREISVNQSGHAHLRTDDYDDGPGCADYEEAYVAGQGRREATCPTWLLQRVSRPVSAWSSSRTIAGGLKTVSRTRW